MSGTKFPERVVDVASYPHRVLKSAEFNKKLKHKRVQRGPLKGAVIKTLTLEERRTCPSACPMWKRCYGDNMPFADRLSQRNWWLLVARMRGELAWYFRTEDKILLRFPILGDFPSVTAAASFRRLLEEFPGLYIYGYSHRHGGMPDSLSKAIGRFNERTKQLYPERFRLRFSNRRVQDSFNVKGIGPDMGGVQCLEQTHGIGCAECMLCIYSKRPIWTQDHHDH